MNIMKCRHGNLQIIFFSLNLNDIQQIEQAMSTPK